MLRSIISAKKMEILMTKRDLRSVRMLLAAFLLLAATTLAPAPIQAAEEADAYGDTRLHQVEKEILALAEESRKDISYQEHAKLLEKAASEVKAKVTGPHDLATLAVWATLSGYPNTVGEGYINYDQVVKQARTTAIDCLGKMGNADAESALWRIAHQTNLDGHDSEELCEAMSRIKKKDFLFGDRVYVHFLDPALEKTPLSAENAAFRIALCDELWKHWKAPGGSDAIAQATFVVDGDRQFTNVKVTPKYFGKSKNAELGLQYTEAARTALNKCALKQQLPKGMNKARVQVDFYGR